LPQEKRSSLFFILFIFSLSTHAALEARWTGVAGVLLNDGATTILIDPVVTKPTLKHWLFNSILEIDEQKVTHSIKKWGNPRVAAIFASHEHFDHVSDIGVFAQKTNATVYGGESLKRIVKFQAPDVPFQLLKNRESIDIGNFRVTIFYRQHAPLIPAIDYHFLPGEVSPDFQGKFYDFNEGEVMSFVIEHPEGNIIVDSGSQFFDPLSVYAGKILAYFMGVSNKKSVDDIVGKHFSIIKPRYAIPIHFDFFFYQSEMMEQWLLPGVELQELEQIAKDRFPEMKFIIPQKNEVIKF
jgi:L-ascorbate metabolism protein UlaG (beta-lactamase superfamily)